MHVKRRNALAFKIAAIFSGACGGRSRGGPNPSFHTGGQQNECMEGITRLVSEKSRQIQVAARKRRRVALRFYGFLRRRSSGFNLRKWRRRMRMIKARSGHTRWMLRPCFRRIIAKKRDVDETKKAQEAELCKKRILMGGKCRPLNPSGVLHYDEEGIFLPEDVLV